jgi:uncharacterized C2H2 Zn-finger protein
VRCPYCGAEFASERRRIREAAAAAGGIAGILRGVSVALSEIDGKHSATGYAYLIKMTEVVLGGVIGAAEGSAAGSLMGEAIEQFLPILRCPHCESSLQRSRSHSMTE